MIEGLSDLSNPVILLISVDTLRQDHLGCYGYRRDTTPFIDQLAAHGRRYTRAFTPVPNTFPAHTCLFTARYPGWNGVSVHNGGYLQRGSTWLGPLHAARVRTAGFVSSFVLDRQMTNGFDLAYFDDAMTLSELNRSELRRRGESTVDTALRWFSSMTSDESVFCFVHLMDVHGTYDVPDRLAGQFVQPHYSEESLPICKMFSPGGIPDIFRLDQLPDFPGRQIGQYYVDRYDGCLTYVDQQIRRLIEELTRKFGTRLLCIIVSDHGEAFGEDDYWCMHSHGVLPNQTQIPFIMWSAEPGRIAGLVEASKPVSLLDIGPTILDLFGVAPAHGARYHGWSLFDHAKQWATRRLFSQSYTQMLAYNEEIKEGAVVGDQATSYDFTLDIRQHSSYFDRQAEASAQSIAEGMLFLSLAQDIGSRFKAVRAAYYERHNEHLIAQHLSDLGYMDDPTTAPKDDFDHYVQPLPVYKGQMPWTLSLARTYALAQEFQIRPALHLACGRHKLAGFVGLNGAPALGVDVMGDLDAPLPFQDDTFDLVYIGFDLARVADLNRTMKEIYRVCGHQAQLCIVVPYYAHAVNIANPHHKQKFNEHTPRFWTSAPQVPFESREFHPEGAWSLSASDDEPGMDMRCLRMEFFYCTPYREFAGEERIAALRKYLDVSDQIVYHLMVLKKPLSEVEMHELARQIQYYDPPQVAMRRLQEQLELREAELIRAQATVDERDAALNRSAETVAVHEAAITRAQMMISAHAEEIERMNAILSSRDTELNQIRLANSAQGSELKQVRLSLSEREAELKKERAEWAAHAGELEHVRTLLTTSIAATQHVSARGKLLARELDLVRRGRAMHWLTRLLDRSDARDDIDQAFAQLRDDSLIFTPGFKAYRLQPSQNLQHIPFAFYPLEINRPNLAGIRLAPVVDIPLTTGTFGIEIVSPMNTIVAQCELPVDKISDRLPTHFDFSPLRDSDHGRFWLRVFVRGVDAPVRIFEWRKYTAFGLGPLRTRAFCGVTFG